tara:strand:+ start:3704 stop:4243 length:540 start_codon:yes stop_codon:yes gene_type:complete
MMQMLFWNRYKVIRGIVYTAIAVCLLGCSSLQPVSYAHSSAVDAVQAVSSVARTSNLWLPIMFTGFLALLAGIINLVFLRGGAKLLVIGVLLALTPPITEYVLSSISPLIGILIAVIGLALLGCVVGRWYGRKDIMKRAKARADYIVGNGKDVLTKGQAADVLTNLDNKAFEADYPIGK